MEKKQAMQIRYENSEIIGSSAESIIFKEMIDLKGAKVAYLMSYPYIKKNVAAKIVKADKVLKFFASDVDYVIIVSNEIYNVLNEEMREMLLLNQLLKICPVTNEKTGSIAYKIVDHDFKGFHKMFKKYGGMDWFYKLREINSSLYDLSPSESEAFTV